MKNLAPNITRQRLLLEGFYDIPMSEASVKDFLLQLASALNLKTYGDPIIFSPAGMGKKENQGFDAFIPLIDSGICLYVWTAEKFFSSVIYTCKSFSTDEAIRFTQSYLKTTDLESKSF